jgi:hypothetical protein
MTLLQDETKFKKDYYRKFAQILGSKPKPRRLHKAVCRFCNHYPCYLKCKLEKV